MEFSDPQITIESLTDKVREGALARLNPNGATDSGAASAANAPAAARAEHPSAAASDFPALTSLEAVQLTLQPDFEPHASDQYHAHELLQYHDRNFIQNAYRAILKRGPDATGYKAFIESLRDGRLNKIDVLARLRYSAEGRAKKVQVKGLFLPAAVRQLYRLPFVGYLLRLGVGLARLPAAVRHQQQFEAHVHAQQQQVVELVNHHSVIISQHQREVVAALGQLAETAHAANSRQQQQLALLKDEQQAIIVSQRTMQERLLERLNASQGSLLERLGAVERQFDVLIDKAVAHWQRGIARLETQHREQSEQAIARAEALAQDMRTEADQLARQLRAELERVFEEVRQVFENEQGMRAELALQRQRVTRLLEEAEGRLPAPFERPELAVLADEQQHLHDAFYLSLEDRFRGSPTEIKERLKVYLPLVERARGATAGKPLFDIGCGRGEWLELLREANQQASGVDSNRVLVAEGRTRGLSIVEADLLAALRELPDESLGALTGFHIVEHLPLESLLGLLDETVRVVSPGGLVIFETPNPENVLVGSCNFYFDPTHRNPLPAPIMKFLLESRGFRPVEIIRLNPSDAEPVAGDTDLVKRFNQYFYGPMDYAVVGWKI